MAFISKFALGSSAAALLLTAAAPAMAVETPGRVVSNIDRSQTEYRRWGHHRDQISGDDILTGIGILTGIVILADIVGQSGKRKQRESEPRYDPRNAPTPYPPIASGDTTSAGDDIGIAVSSCSQAAERSAGEGNRVQEIRAAVREGNAWRVDGILSGKSPNSFSCGVTNGRIDFVKLGVASI
jgi:hypothetical protein